MKPTSISQTPGHPPDAWTRRQFVTRVAASAAAASCLDGAPAVFAKSTSKLFRTGSARPKVALLATEVRRHSHAQHFIDRFLEGYGWQGRHYHPAVDLVSLYVDQFPEGDLSRDRAARHPVKIYPTIAEALTLGGAKLAVDGIVIIGEHGKYPRNEKGQTLYPRYKWFKEVVRVFEASGRVVPVFNDKHLSTDWRECREMVADSKRLEFPFLAGSSLPVTWRIPSIDLPMNTRLRESVCACYGGVDSYDFHGLETAQCMSERRKGGEVGVASIHAVKGDKIWEMMTNRESTQKLLLAALNRSHTCKAPPGYTSAGPSIAWVRESSPDAIAYFIEHRDGFHTTMFLFNGLVQDFTYAGLERGGKIIATQMHLPMPTRIATTADFFNPLVNHIEKMTLSGVASYPVERTLLTSGMTLSAVESLHRGQIRLDTTELNVAYRPATASTFWRA